MRAIQVRGFVGDDGILRLEVPVPYKNTELEMILVVGAEEAEPTPESLGWPAGFFERFAGVFVGSPILRGKTVLETGSEVMG